MPPRIVFFAGQRHDLMMSSRDFSFLQYSSPCYHWEIFAGIFFYEPLHCRFSTCEPSDSDDTLLSTADFASVDNVGVGLSKRPPTVSVSLPPVSMIPRRSSA